MHILFSTKEKLTFSEAPPSRILNLKKILRKYHKVSVVCRGNPVHEDNTEVIDIPETSFMNNQAFKIAMVLRTIKWLATREVDYIITREYLNIPFIKPFAKLFGAKIIYDMHCYRYKELITEGRKLKSMFMRPVERLAHRLADHVLTVSPGIYGDFEYKDKATLFRNGVDLEVFKQARTLESSLRRQFNIPAKNKIVTFLGNWMSWVDIDTLLSASDFLPKDVTVLVIGKGYDGREGKKQSSRIISTGRVDHDSAVDLLNISDICVLPYKDHDVLKHLSIRKTLEYLAAGRPIVMSDSKIQEKAFLKEGINYVPYRPGDAGHLAQVITETLKDKKLLQKLGKNNKTLAEKFSWESKLEESGLLDYLQTKRVPHIAKPIVTIIIKSLNEEEHIENSIASALLALKGLDGEVILIDSGSTDNTIKLAKKYPITIYQLQDNADACCGVGPEGGFQMAKGDYLYILDGDMTLDKGFIKAALPYLQNDVAGVGGIIKEHSEDNLIFQVRAKGHSVQEVSEVNQLGMGGLYRRDAVEDVGYFSNPSLRAYEEFELGAMLHKKGYRLLRIPEPMIDHFGDTTTYLQTIASRIKSKYIFGSGQYIKSAFRNGHALRTLIEMRIYIATLVWQAVGIGCLCLVYVSVLPLLVYAIISVALIIILAVFKKSNKRLLFSIISWNVQALGMLLGLFMRLDDPRKIKVRLTKLG